MGIEVAVGLGVAVAAASAAVSYQQANERNKAISEANKRNADYAAKVRAANTAQAEQAESNQQQRLSREYDLYSGAVRARGEQLGATGSQGLDAIQRSLIFGASANSANLRINLELQRQAIAANTQPSFQAGQSALLAGISGGIEGAQVGFGLGNSLQGLYGAQQSLGNAQKIQSASAAFGYPDYGSSAGAFYNITF